MDKERGNKKLKILDKILGCALLLLIALFSKKRLNIPDSVRKIALIKTAAIGDTVLLAYIVGPLKERFPGAVIYLFTGEGNFETGKCIKDIDCVIRMTVTNPFKALKTIRRAGKFDVVADFGSWPRIDALITAFSRSAFSVGFKTGRQYRHYAYDIAIDHRNDRHELNNYFALLKPLGVKPVARHSGVPLLIDKDTPFQLGRKKRYVVLHPFPGGTKAWLKEWPSENWLSVARYFLNKKWVVLFSGGPDDTVKVEQITTLLRDNPGVLNIAGKFRIQSVIAILANVDLIITVNTGIMHLASAVNTPMIALHGPTNPKRWGPLNENAIVVEPRNVSCAPCLNLGFEYSGCEFNRCMRSISPDSVIEAFEDLWR